MNNTSCQNRNLSSSILQVRIPWDTSFCACKVKRKRNEMDSSRPIGFYRVNWRMAIVLDPFKNKSRRWRSEAPPPSHFLSPINSKRVIPSYRPTERTLHIIDDVENADEQRVRIRHSIYRRPACNRWWRCVNKEFIYPLISVAITNGDTRCLLNRVANGFVDFTQLIPIIWKCRGIFFFFFSILESDTSILCER